MSTETDLASAFAAPDRAAGLTGASALRRPRPEQPAPATTPAPAVPAPVPPVATPAPAPASAGERLAPDYAVVYLAEGVHRRLSRYASSVVAKRANGGRKPSFSVVVMNAIEKLHGELPAMFAVPVAAPDGALFTRREPARRTLTAPPVQVTLKMGQENVTVLDGLAGQHGQSRSAFVETILDRYLPGGSRAPQP